MPGKMAKKLREPMTIARIARPIGLNGEVKITGFTGCGSCLLDNGEITVLINDQFRRLTVTHSSNSGSWMRFKLADVNTVEQAALLQGAEIVIEYSDRIEKPPSEYYVDDLIGCSVKTDDMIDLGFLNEVWHQDHHDIWVVTGAFGEILIPAVKEFILEVNLNTHSISVRHVEGLWDEE